MTENRGNVLFLILIAVGLFAALSYAVVGSNRSGTASIESEKEKINEGDLDTYQAQLNMGANRLRLINQCDTIDYTIPENQVAGDKTCHMFHPEGGGVAFRGFCNSPSKMLSLSIGDQCGLLTYAGISGGNRIYTTLADQGSLNWSANDTITGATSTSDGLSNTNLLVTLRA